MAKEIKFKEYAEIMYSIIKENKLTQQQKDCISLSITMAKDYDGMFFG